MLLEIRFPTLSSRGKGHRGRKRIGPEYPKLIVKQTPPSNGSTTRFLASETKISKSKIQDFLEFGEDVHRTNTLKPLLTDQKTFDRMRFAFCFIMMMPRENKFIFQVHEKCRPC